MTPDEFDKIKAEEKAHLLEMRRLKGLARSAQQKGRVAQAFEKIVGGSAGALDALEQAMNRVGRDTAMSEARFEIATESNASAVSDEDHEEVLRAQRARDLVAQMKSELSAPSRAEPAATDAPSRADGVTAAPKTIGRPPPPAPDKPDDSASAPASTKTLGRRA
jgi:hypothetical protein